MIKKKLGAQFRWPHYEAPFLRMWNCFVFASDLLLASPAINAGCGFSRLSSVGLDVKSISWEMYRLFTYKVSFYAGVGCWLLWLTFGIRMCPWYIFVRDVVMNILNYCRSWNGLITNNSWTHRSFVTRKYPMGSALVVLSTKRRKAVATLLMEDWFMVRYKACRWHLATKRRTKRDLIWDWFYDKNVCMG